MGILSRGLPVPAQTCLVRAMETLCSCFSFTARKWHGAQVLLDDATTRREEQRNVRLHLRISRVGIRPQPHNIVLVIWHATHDDRHSVTFQCVCWEGAGRGGRGAAATTAMK